jgi:transcriptional regulator with XRE-family HTH domain
LSNINSYKFAKALGAFLKYERMSQKITIKKISKALQLNPSTIVSIEDGKHHASFVNVYKILIFLEINHAFFMTHLSTELKDKENTNQP